MAKKLAKPTFGFKKDLEDSDKWEISKIAQGVDPAAVETVVKAEDDTKAQETTFKTVQEPDVRHCQIPIDLLDFAPDEYNFFPRPSDDVIRALIWDILIHGQNNPLIVWKQPGGRHMVLSGNTRLFVFQLIKQYDYNGRAKDFATADCHLYEYESLTETDAKRIVIGANMTQRAQESPSLVFKSAIALRRYHGEDKRAGRHKGVSTATIRDLVALQTGCSSAKVGILFQLEDLDERFLALWDTKAVTNQWLLAIAKLPSKLQEFIYNTGYYERKMTPKQLQKIANAKDEEEIASIVNEPEHYRISAYVELPYRLPKRYKTMTLCAAEDEQDELRRTILNAVNNNHNLSEDTRQYIQDMLS